jgi:hypothetical protein
MKIPDVPYQVARWRREHPGEDIPDGHVFTQPWPAGPSLKGYVTSLAACPDGTPVTVGFVISS